jgi:hypothetical protein
MYLLGCLFAKAAEPLQGLNARGFLGWARPGDNASSDPPVGGETCFIYASTKASTRWPVVSVVRSAAPPSSVRG